MSTEFTDYLKSYSRYTELPLTYNELTAYEDTFPISVNGVNTLWESVIYPPSDRDRIVNGLVKLYQELNADGGSISHLFVGSIDFCSYGNSKPFRIKIINEINDNHDYFYVKKIDASRVYGLELEHIFSPNKINYLVNNDSLIEEHIIGVPGDQFVNSYIKKNENFKALRLAKEFVKFNERCFVRLLGDMRAYNYVVVMKQDFDKVQYRIRAMDFDQQSFEGRKSIYLPQYYKDNLYYVEMAQKEISIETAEQYKKEERALLAKRVLLAKSKFIELMSAMSNDTISTEENIRELAKGLNRHHKTSSFTGLSSMAELLLLNVNLCLDLNLKV